ncbi:MAG: GNAT family N-acetyltransferase [Rhodospirillaceae bacterium]
MSRKPGAAFQSTLRLTLQFLTQRHGLNARLGYRPMTLLLPPSTNTPSGALASAGLAAPGGARTFVPVTAGSQVIRLANSADELDAAQALRYRVFYDEMGAKPDAQMQASRRDFDKFDTICDHLLVVDAERKDDPVVGTYRFIRREHARAAGSFYSASEYDITKLASFPGRVLELGRSCVDAGYRNRATMQLLWRGVSEYVNAYGIDLMFGCASLPGTDPQQLAVQLSYLYHYHLAPEALRATALPHRKVEMNLLPKEAIDPKRALASLPPLLKGYLRVGGFIGDGAVVDHQFNTTDVCIIVKTDLIEERYTRHYDIGTESASFKKAS